MKITSKLKILDQIYSIYEKFTASLDLACKKYCDLCCTAGVTLTTLEGYKIMHRLTAYPDTDIIPKIHSAAEIKRFRPQITTNRLAQLCAADIEPPAEIYSDNRQKCPLLQDHVCPIYELRPFGCRCLVSRRNCGEKGYAEIDDFVLSVSTVFLQTIEHVDAEGWSIIGEMGLVAERQIIPPAVVAVGQPVKIIGEIQPRHKERWLAAKKRYQDLTRRNTESLKRIQPGQTG